ncbi:hypothetical protein K0U83_12125 [bacterium]|nr:hypothetical protein [bacterium]
MNAQTLPRSQRRDPIMPGNRLRCRINCRSATVGIPGMHRPAEFGISEVVIHENDLPALKAMVETVPEVWEQAEKIAERKILDHVAEANGVSIDEVIGRKREDWPPAWVKSEETHIGTSVGGEFRNLTGHDHSALLSVDVLEELPGEVGREMALAAQVAQSMTGSDAGALRAEIAELRAELASLKASGQGGSKRGSK